MDDYYPNCKVLCFNKSLRPLMVRLTVLSGYSSFFDGTLMMQWSSIKMDYHNDFYGLINCPPFLSLISLYAGQA